MQCPYCRSVVPVLATRCPACTTEFGRSFLWIVNILGIALVIVVAGLLVRLFS